MTPHPHDHSTHDHSTHDHSTHDHSTHDHSTHDHSTHDHSTHDGATHGHSGHEHAAAAGGAASGPPGAGRASWTMAAQATLHCLIGCAIGEVLGMVIGTALGWSAGATIVLAVALAFVFGYALTMRGVLRAGVDFRTALRVALAADTVSIAVMELVDNAVMVTVPGAMEAGLANWLFWASLAFALAVAFVLTVPVNRWLISRGRGHAVVHGYHHAH